MISVDPPRYGLVLTQCGPHKLRVMVAIRQLRPDLSPAEVKALLEGGEASILDNLLRENARQVQRTLQGLGAEVEIRDAAGEYVYEFYRVAHPPKPYPG